MRKSVGKKPFANKKYVPYKLITSYLSDIFSEYRNADGYICFRSGPTAYAGQSWLEADKLQNQLKPELSRHDYRDTYFTFSTFKKCKKPNRTTETLQTIFAWSIDVDYVNEAAHPLDVYDYIVSEMSLPKPNYIEYGHRLRMIYIFKEPLRLFPKQKESLLLGFHFLQKSFCEMINNELSFGNCSFGAEANHASSFFRIPGSVNTKDGSTIEIKHISDERWTLQELFEEWIPNSVLDKSGNKEEWLLKWKTKTKSQLNTFNTYALWERRMKVFEDLRISDNPHRKLLCHFYGNGLIQTKRVTNEEEYFKELKKFNMGFERPLTDVELKRHFKWTAKKMKVYKYSDQYIADSLEVDRSLFSKVSRKEKDAKRYDERKKMLEVQNETKQQKIKVRQSEINKLLSKNMTYKKIAEILDVSVATIKRDVEMMGITKKRIKKLVKNNAMIIRKLFLQKIFGNFSSHAENTFGSFAVHPLPLLPCLLNSKFFNTEFVRKDDDVGWEKYGPILQT